MRVISTGNEFSIYDDSLQTYDKFPTQSYIVRFNNMRGFYMEKYTDIEITEDKIYGVHNEKVQKVLNAFNQFNRNLGVILSGNKGIGKSLFAKMLAIEAMKRNIPLIVVDKYFPGIASYIESIDQEVMVLFDEFDKTFGDVQTPQGEASPQTHLLSLFDGVSGGKKLFVITCNELTKLNDYLVNRPGRFHYHFRFDYPTADEIREYLHDKLDHKYYGEIEDVVSFSRKVDLNYDCLRAIAFEVNNGIPFKKAIIDLNIINLQNRLYYNVILHFNNDMSVSCKDQYIDLFSDDVISFWMSDNNGDPYVLVEFEPSAVIYDVQRMCYTVPPKDIKLDFDEDACSDGGKKIELVKAAGVNCLMLRRKNAKELHYIL